MNAVTTRGFGIAGGFVGSAPLVVTGGYGFGGQPEERIGYVRTSLSVIPTVRAAASANPTVRLNPSLAPVISASLEVASE